jgi:hypothetical protein
MDDPTCPPIIYIMFICTILFCFLSLINVFYLMWCYWERKSSVARLRDRSFQRQEAVEPDESEKEVLITFPAEVWVSPNGKEIPHFFVLRCIDPYHAHLGRNLQLL